MVEQNLQAYTSNHTLEHRKTEIKIIGSCCIIFSYVPFFIAILMLLNPASANPLPSDNTVRVKETSFAEKLQNPCALADASRLQRESLSPEERLNTKGMLIKELKARVMLLNESATTILRTNVLHDCSSLKLPPVTEVPNMEELATGNVEEMNRIVHISMLNLTAHICFTVTQLEKYIGETCNSDGLLASAKTLATNMRELLCIHRLYMLTLKEGSDSGDESEFSELYSQVLNEPLMDQPLCSRRSVRDCQTMTNAVMMLNEMAKFYTSRSEEPA
ncbi:uncharacterized protein LOC129985279 [Argiope bruennichi]|uniref:Uncharacterized protein n=1 Tax=Argiope bruennichi TaxID=94029 RepID=A0A8T0ENH2_ARGBR|nr:uncharacterized protein LOC129985279 [Argiope bruennichi]KAF8773749.1 hypothetical protein HNY73_016381 [Argiope bruennichi]